MIQPAWDDRALRDPHAQPDKPRRIRSMFDAIAPTYRRVNTLATLGRDAAWRRRAVAQAAVRPGDVVLDVCCGTGDMIEAFAHARPAPALLVGVDFAPGMLRSAHVTPSPVRIVMLCADATRLPLADASADVISCAFGVRNFGDLATGLAEMYRVARPGARVVILEFAPPKNRWVRAIYQAYCEYLLPLLAALASHERMNAYRYLARSIRTFEPPEALSQRLQTAGFEQPRITRMNFGGVALYRAVKPR